MSDEGTRSTNKDATQCKRWCVEKGYFEDPFIKYLAPTASSKTPEISRGYYARVQCIRQGVRGFVRQHERECQIISVGAGSCTLFWNLALEGLQPQAYVELDFPQIVMRKLKVISKNVELSSVISEECAVTKGSLHSPRYHLVSIDLRDKAAISSLVSTCSLDPALPTLVIAECVLCYMPPDASAHLLKWTAETFPNSVFFNYEPCNMNDRFGGIMIENMRARDCELPGILACPTLRDQEARFMEAGFASATAIDMNAALAALPACELDRIKGLEFLDEQELLTQLLQHYCLSWGSKGNVKWGSQNTST